MFNINGINQNEAIIKDIKYAIIMYILSFQGLIKNSPKNNKEANTAVLGYVMSIRENINGTIKKLILSLFSL